MLLFGNSSMDLIRLNIRIRTTTTRKVLTLGKYAFAVVFFIFRPTFTLRVQRTMKVQTWPRFFSYKFRQALFLYLKDRLCFIEFNYHKRMSVEYIIVISLTFSLVCNKAKFLCFFTSTRLVLLVPS